MQVSPSQSIHGKQHRAFPAFRNKVSGINTGYKLQTPDTQVLLVRLTIHNRSRSGHSTVVIQVENTPQNTLQTLRSCYLVLKNAENYFVNIHNCYSY